MSKESKSAASGTEDVRLGPGPDRAAPAAPVTKTVEEWARDKGFADVTGPHPHYAHRNWMQTTRDAGAGNRALFAFAKAYFQWPLGKLLSEADFDKAMAEVQGRKFGEH